MRRRAQAVGVAAAAVALVTVPVWPVGSAPAPRPPVAEVGPLVSGTDLYSGGTWAWTDYVYDDRGAAAEPGGGGAVGYPDGQENTADLVQVQVEPGRKGTRLTALLQTLRDGDRPSVGIGLDLDADPTTGAPALPGAWQPNGPLGVEVLLTMTLEGAEVQRWTGSGWADAGESPVSVDRFQGAGSLTTTLPRTVADASVAPAWRLVAVAGRQDADWRTGGPVHDLACVRDAPVHYASKHQGDVLAGTEASDTAACRIDLAAVRSRASRLPDQTSPGYHVFLYRSALDLGGGTASSTATIPGTMMLGAYQPYLVVLPPSLPSPAPLIVFVHGAQTNYVGDSGGEPVVLGSQRFFGPEGDDGEAHQTTLGQVYGVHPTTDPPGLQPDGFAYEPYSPPAVVIQTQSRGESGGYRGEVGYEGIHEADVFEAMADVRHRFAIDDDRVVLAGPSMGGIGTFQLAARNPDVFASAFAMVGRPSDPEELVNLRNIPFRQVNAQWDPLVPQPAPTEAALALHDLGYDARYWLLNRRHHETIPSLFRCVFEEALTHVRRADPARVVYRYDPAQDAVEPDKHLAIVHDRAYWASELRVREGSAVGMLDATTGAISGEVLEATRSRTQRQNVTEGRDLCGPNPDVRTSDTWTELRVDLAPAATQPDVANRADVTLTGLGAARFDLARMRLSPRAPLTVAATTDGPATLRLTGDWPRRVAVTTGGTTSILRPVDGVLRLDLPGAGPVTFEVRPA